MGVEAAIDCLGSINRRSIDGLYFTTTTPAYREKQSASIRAAAAKLYASEVVKKIASDAVQNHGGHGYMKSYPVSRYYRQAKLMQIVEGTSEVQRIVIARSLWTWIR